ncbi:CRISPR-associated helicase Cas3' [Nocardia halotolerans]|uniref:CRISPR-associated helicase Cas3 n=1 Tax=Nocardia halotolerans TaxID=1755878 RepID=A0ABV8VHM8_9NOCA
MDIWAHSRSAVSGRRHHLSEHCRSTAWWAGWFAEEFGAGQVAFAAGLSHDAGKASCTWQDRLAVVDGTDAPVGVPHKEFGARLVAPRLGVFAMTIAGHHGGLTDLAEFKAQLAAIADDSEPVTAERFFRCVPEASTVLCDVGLLPTRWRTAPQQVTEMRVRMVFSALVDADHLDTGAHRAGWAGPRVAAHADMNALVARFERRRAAAISAHSRDSVVGGLREEVYAASVAAASRGPGVFRLAAPTGLGKTFAQAGFGLHHAAAFGKRRVVVAVPFITITEQNAAVYRGLLDTEDEQVVLEHHSSVRYRSENDDNGDNASGAADRWARLAAENWDAPFVVTTTVQLFESLFGRKPSQLRKLHRLANAVLILDEVQALPHKLLLPILDGLRILAEHFGTTVLLTSATQPEFEALSVWNGQDGAGERLVIEEVIADPQPLFDQARRVRYEWRTDPKPTWEQVADEVAVCEQALVVVNSIDDAANLYDLLQVRREGQVWHLSTRLAPRHRREVLAVIIDRMKAGVPTVVVATTLIEAGVDISFPTVWRALSGADSLQQAAGRANRNGEFPDGGVVVVFDPVDGKAPKDNAVPAHLTADMFGPDGPELDNQAVLAAYYRSLYNKIGLDNTVIDRRKDSVGQAIQRNRTKLNFQSVAEGPDTGAGRDRRKAFRMIDDDTVPVVIVDEHHAHSINRWLAMLVSGTDHARTALRELQPWIVQLRRRTVQQPEVAALIEPVSGDLGIWKGAYRWDRASCQGTGLDTSAFQSVL